MRLAALMLDGIELKGRCCVVALGVSGGALRRIERAALAMRAEPNRPVPTT